MTIDELVEELREMGEHPCRAHLPMGATLREAATRIDALEAALRRIKDATANEMRAGDKGYVSRYGIHGIATKALESQP